MSPNGEQQTITLPDGGESSIDSLSNPGITLEFLQNVLQQENSRLKNGPLPEIRSFNVKRGTKPGDNYMSLIYSVEVEFKNKKNHPSRNLFLKCYPTDPGRKQINNDQNLFFNELQIYKEWIGELRRFQTEVVEVKGDETIKIPYPPYVHGECIDFTSPEGVIRKTELLAQLDNYIILEDIRNLGFRMTNRREPLDLDHMKLAIDALAKIHSLSWAYKHHVNPNPVEKFPAALAPYGFTEEAKIGWMGLLEAGIAQAIAILDSEFGPANQYSQAVEKSKKLAEPIYAVYWQTAEGYKDEAQLEKLLRVWPVPEKFGKDAENPVPWRIINHGDCWSNNLLYQYDQGNGKPSGIVLVDLQTASESCVVYDLHTIIYNCTDQTLRKNHLQELLQLYHDTFNGCCEKLMCPTLPGFSIDSLKFRFHRGKLLSYLNSMCYLPVILKEDDKMPDIELVDKEKALVESFTQAMIGDAAPNKTLNERLIGVVNDMVEDGVL